MGEHRLILNTYLVDFIEKTAVECWTCP